MRYKNPSELIDHIQSIDEIEKRFKDRSNGFTLRLYQTLSTLMIDTSHVSELGIGIENASSSYQSRVCSKLIEKGLATMDVDKRDKRSRLISITGEGKKTYQELKNILSEVIQ